jgi:hypothetical protein
VEERHRKIQWLEEERTEKRRKDTEIYGEEWSKEQKERVKSTEIYSEEWRKEQKERRKDTGI